MTTATEAKRGRVFTHINITFERTVTQRQTVTIPVDPGLDAETQHSVAQQLARQRLKTKWETVTESEPEEIEA